MKILQDFIKTNNKIEIITNEGNPSQIPDFWHPVLSSCDILVVIADLHMYIYNSTLDNFKFGADSMLEFLNYLENLKEEMALAGNTLRIYQLGDLYEQRFPGMSPTGGNATASEIRMSHPKYDQIINTMNGLRTHFLYGNHDFELRHFPGFRFGALEGRVYLEHGFSADTWEDFANPSASLWDPAQLVFMNIREIENFFGQMLVELRVIEKDDHFALGVESGEDYKNTYPTAQEYKEDSGYQKYIDHYSNRLINQPDEQNTKICIIGHTHKPHLDTTIDNNNYFYVDAGSWTEGRQDFVVITNEEVSICTFNR